MSPTAAGPGTSTPRIRALLRILWDGDAAGDGEADRSGQGIRRRYRDL